MTILTIDEAAKFLRVTRRTLYRRLEIPRIRIGHQLRFVREDLELWIVGQRGSGVLIENKIQSIGQRVDEPRTDLYHRNSVFRLPSSRSM